MKLTEQFPIQAFNSFVRNYFDLQSTFVRKGLFKSDFYSTQNFLSSIPEIYSAFGQSGNLLNQEGASLLNDFIEKYEILKNFIFNTNPFIDELVSLKFSRSNSVIQLKPEQGKGINYIKESPFLIPTNNLINLKIDNYGLINNQNPNALLFDLIDFNGKPVKIKDVKSIQEKRETERKSLLEKLNPFSLESRGLLPLKATSLGVLDVEIESAVPIKVNKLEPVVSLFDEIASSKEVFSFITPRKKIKFLGYGKDMLFGKSNFDLQVELKIDDKSYFYLNPDEISFGRGEVERNKYFLNLETPIKDFEIKCTLKKKTNIPDNLLIDNAKLTSTVLSLSTSELKKGVTIDQTYFDPELYIDLNASLSSLSPKFFSTSSEIVLSEDYLGIKNLGLLRLSDGEKILSVGTSITDTSFIVERDLLLKTNNLNSKVAWFENEYLIQKENEGIRVESQIELSSLVIQNKEKLFPTETTFGYRSFKKIYKDVIEVDLKKEIQDLRRIESQQSIPYTLSTQTEFPNENEYLVYGDKLRVFIPENLQPFSKISVFGKDILWEKKAGIFKDGSWYFNVPLSHTSTTIQSSTRIEDYFVPETLQISGYELADFQSIKQVSDLRLKVASSTNGTNYFDIPYLPYTNLEVLSEVPYSTSETSILSTATNTAIDVSFLVLPNIERQFLFWSEGKEIKFFEEPSQPLTLNYQRVNGNFQGIAKMPIDFYFKDGLLFSDIETTKNISLRYAVGKAEDLVRFPSQVFLKIEGLNS